MQDLDTHARRAWRLRWLLLAGAAILYGVCLPRTVQNLDTGELVASAWKLTVAHPPGYPLYVWLQHLVTKLLPWGSVFHRAAVGGALCALGALALLLRLARSWLGVALVAVFATLPLVWRYAVLPDVFSLHLLLVAAVVALAHEPPSNRRVWLAAMAFGAGAANHQSIIFVLPLLLLIAWETPSRLHAMLALTAGALVTLALYGSLLLLDVGALDSWGHLRTFTDVTYHFLRSAYGTFRLSGFDTEADLTKILLAFASACGVFGALAFVLIVVHGVQHRRDLARSRAWWLTLLCLMAYIAVFFPAMNVGGHPLHEGVRERFFLLPLLLLAALAVVVVPPRLARLLPVLTGALATLAAVQVVSGDAFGYRDDTVVEDYARNLLTIAKSAGKPAFVVVDSDTQLFSLQYVAATESGFEDVIAMGRGNIFSVDRLKKIQARWPAFVFDVDEIFADDKRQIFRSFIGPNLDAFAVFSMLPVTNPQWRTTFYPLGRRIEPGSGVATESATITLRPPVHKADEHGYVETKELYADYAVYHLARGKALLAMGDRDGAREAFMAGAALVPYCIPCLKNYCKLDDDHDARCGAPLDELMNSEFHYLE